MKPGIYQTWKEFFLYGIVPPAAMLISLALVISGVYLLVKVF